MWYMSGALDMWDKPLRSVFIIVIPVYIFQGMLKLSWTSTRGVPLSGALDAWDGGDGSFTSIPGNGQSSNEVMFNMATNNKLGNGGSSGEAMHIGNRGLSSLGKSGVNYVGGKITSTNHGRCIAVLK